MLCHCWIPSIPTSFQTMTFNKLNLWILFFSLKKSAFKLIVFGFSNHLSAENSKLSAEFELQLLQLLECVPLTFCVKMMKSKLEEVLKESLEVLKCYSMLRDEVDSCR